MNNDTRVEVRGVNALTRALKQVDANTAKQLKDGFRSIAERVATDIRSRVPRRTGRAASSVKARGSQRGGAIAYGGNAAPHFPWLDFGGSTKRRVGGVHRQWQGNPVGEGRYVYPTIRDHNKEIRDETDAVLARVIRGANFDTDE